MSVGGIKISNLLIFLSFLIPTIRTWSFSSWPTLVSATFSVRQRANDTPNSKIRTQAARGAMVCDMQWVSATLTVLQELLNAIQESFSMSLITVSGNERISGHSALSIAKQ